MNRPGVGDRREARDRVGRRIITYSLRQDGRNSDAYYRAIAAFADDWTASAAREAGDLIAGFRDYRREAGLPDRSEPECAFELLALGVLLRQHGGEAARSPRWLTVLLSWLVRLQEQHPRLKGAARLARGWLGMAGRRPQSQEATGPEVEGLLAWLRANGEDARAERLAQWGAYLEEIGTAPGRKAIARCVRLAEEFGRESEAALGSYTEGVQSFVAGVAPKRRFRYDAEFVSRSREEYHLGMLGTELLNRAYRARFLAAGHKLVIVPPCMRAQPAEKCKAIETRFGAQCQHCTPTCRVHQITKLGEKRGFEVYMIPDELRAFAGSAGSGGLGVVGVSCALTNWSGGWQTDALGVPAQGVLLDYVGCAYHWDEEGFPTDVNLRKLEQVALQT
ncbi:MAG: DUF116 domain-containing protein [Chloroflexi bacterium]|nr:DUF116 domain-containing protein [Chloroflexota bacterium]